MLLDPVLVVIDHDLKSIFHLLLLLLSSQEQVASFPNLLLRKRLVQVHVVLEFVDLLLEVVDLLVLPVQHLQLLLELLLRQGERVLDSQEPLLHLVQQVVRLLVLLCQIAGSYDSLHVQSHSL